MSRGGIRVEWGNGGSGLGEDLVMGVWGREGALNGTD